MATATISDFSQRFPCHGVYTSIAVEMGDNKLGWCMGYDTQYQNFFGQGVPITIPSDAAANVTSISISITYHGYNGLNFGYRTFYAGVSSSKWNTQDGNAYFNNIKGLTSASFQTDYNGGSQTKTMTISGLSLAPGSTYYVYFHNAGNRDAGQLYVVTSVTVTCTYEEGGRVKIYTSNGWVSAIPWVYTSSGWVKAKPWVYTSSGWQRAK